MGYESHPLVISIISILVTNLLCLMPPTLNQSLPNTVQEAAALEDKLSVFLERRRKRSSRDTDITHIDKDSNRESNNKP